MALRPWTAGDGAELLAASADELVHRYRYSLPHDGDEARVWLEATERHRRSGERLELAVTVDGDPAPIGSVSLWGLHRRNRTAMVSWWLGAAGRGRGAGSASVRLLAAWAFDTLKLARLTAHIEIDNAGSQRLAERCGFRREGRQRSHQQLRDGTRADVFVYGLLAGELT